MQYFSETFDTYISISETPVSNQPLTAQRDDRKLILDSKGKWYGLIFNRFVRVASTRWSDRVETSRNILEYIYIQHAFIQINKQ